MSGGQRLRASLAAPGMIKAPLAHDLVSARLIEELGFGGVLIGGGAVAQFRYGVPDMGLIGPAEMAEVIARVAESVNIPIIADMDDGGGNPAQIYHAVRRAEHAGAAAVMIEDLYSSGKHRVDAAGREIYDADEIRPLQVAVDAISAAADARVDDQTVILARTDVLVKGSLNEAIDRANSYAEAGADLALLLWLPFDDCATAAEQVRIPIMHVVGDAVLSAEKDAALERSGIKVRNDALSIKYAAYEGMRNTLLAIRDGAPAVTRRAGVPLDFRRTMGDIEWGARFRLPG